MPTVAAMLGAALPYTLLELVHLSDEGGWDAPAPVAVLLWSLWVVVSSPGAIAPGPPTLKLVVASVFWAAAAWWTVRVSRKRRDHSR